MTNNNFQNQNNAGSLQRSNDHLITQYINPLSGLINISIDGIVYFKQTKKITKAGFLYHMGERILTGYKSGQIINSQVESPKNFLNGFVSTGLYFQSGAWERNNAKNVGVCWLAIRFISCYTNSKQIKDFLPNVNTNGIYCGYSLGFGIEINDFVNLKLVYYKYLKPPEIDYILPIYQFSFNYSLKN